MSSASNRPDSEVITEEEILHLAKLSSIELTDSEVKKYQSEVSTILEMIDKLKEIDTQGVEPTYQVSGNQNVMREDNIEGDIVAAEKLLELSPDKLNNQIKVKKVL